MEMVGNRRVCGVWRPGGRRQHGFAGDTLSGLLPGVCVGGKVRSHYTDHGDELKFKDGRRQQDWENLEGPKWPADLESRREKALESCGGRVLKLSQHRRGPWRE